MTGINEVYLLIATVTGLVVFVGIPFLHFSAKRLDAEQELEASRESEQDVDPDIQTKIQLELKHQATDVESISESDLLAGFDPEFHEGIYGQGYAHAVKQRQKELDALTGRTEWKGWHSLRVTPHTGGVKSVMGMESLLSEARARQDHPPKISKITAELSHTAKRLDMALPSLISLIKMGWIALPPLRTEDIQFMDPAPSVAPQLKTPKQKPKN